MKCQAVAGISVVDGKVGKIEGQLTDRVVLSHIIPTT
jgi:hypothetical protein